MEHPLFSFRSGLRSKMLSNEEREHKIAKLSAQIEELRAEDELFREVDGGVYADAIDSLQNVIYYHKGEIEKSTT